MSDRATFERTDRAARTGLITRERLVSRLLGAADTPIAVVIAPAGYGKTTPRAADEPQPVVRGRDPDRARACFLLLDDVAAARAHLGDAARYLRQTPDAIVLSEWLEEASKEADSAAAVHGHWPLTTAELRLLHCLPTHLSFREIAEQLFVSTNTVKTQAQSTYRKLGVSSRAEAVATADAAGLIETGQAASPHGLTEHRQSAGRRSS